jgi:hypothetical protein
MTAPVPVTRIEHLTARGLAAAKRINAHRKVMAEVAKLAAVEQQRQAAKGVNGQ